MKTRTRISLLALFASTALFADAAATNLAACARGGGGFHGGYGGYRDNYGGYRGGEGDREGHGYEGDRGISPAAYDAGHSDAFNNAARPSDQELRAGANQSYNWGAGRSLATDGGFGAYAGGAGQRMTSLSPASVASEAQAVRSAYGNEYGAGGMFDRGWWGAHPGYWDRRMDDAWAWEDCGWGNLYGWWGVPNTQPAEYDYGTNITYQNNNVYYGSQPVESADAYYTQAQTLAASSPAALPATAQQQKKDWKPLGVFSLVQGSQTNSTTLFQLATNKKGAIKGTYYNELTQETQPIQGAIDKKNMRAAWTVGNNKDVVYDTGVANLLKGESTLLLHIGKGKTEQFVLVRLPQPNKKKTA
jgi:hypothetical protein